MDIPRRQFFSPLAAVTSRVAQPTGRLGPGLSFPPTDEFAPHDPIDLWVIATRGTAGTVFYDEMQDEVATPQVRVTEPYEADLIARAKARSPEAWTEIYTAHYSAIFRYAKARVFDATIAEDLTSAVFVGALKGIDSYKYRGRPLLAWLYSIARNVVASHQRELLGSRAEGLRLSLDLPRQVVSRLMRRPRPDDAGAAESEPISIASGEADPAMSVDRLDLREALAKLSTNQREVVILRFLVGLSAQEVAEVMGKKPAAVYSLQARAILALREQLR